MTKVFMVPVLSCLLCGLAAAQEAAGPLLKRTESIGPGTSMTMIERNHHSRRWLRNPGRLALADLPRFETIAGRQSAGANDGEPSYRNGVVTLPAGIRSVELYTLSGKKVWRYSRMESQKAQSVNVPDRVSRQPLKLRFRRE